MTFLSREQLMRDADRRESERPLHEGPACRVCGRTSVAVHHVTGDCGLCREGIVLS